MERNTTLTHFSQHLRKNATKEEFFHEEHFVGESMLLTTLTQLSNPPKILYWCTGHGELDGKNGL